MGKNNIVAGLEIARTKVRMAVGQFEDGKLEFLGFSECASPGYVKNGAIINLDGVTEAIIKLVDGITQKTSKRINSVFVNITGLNCKQEEANPVLTLPQRGSEITEKDIEHLIESCKIISVPLDRSLLYLLPLEYIIDGQDGIKEPIGLCASRLEAKVLIITAGFNQVQNIIKAVNSAGLEADEIILTALANAASALNMEEKKEGVLLIDFKTDLTELSIFKDSALVFFETVPKGQQAVTEKIAQRLNIPMEAAEDLKLSYGFLDSAQQDIRNQETVPLEWMGIKQNILRGELNKLINEELGSLFDSISGILKNIKHFNDIIKRGAVLTGGAASMEGFLENVAQRFSFTTKLGRDSAVPMGLVALGLEKQKGRLKPNVSFLRKMYRKADELLTEYF